MAFILRRLNMGRLRRGKDSDLPERVRRTIQEQGDATERLIGWVQFAVVLTFATLYAIAPKAF